MAPQLEPRGHSPEGAASGISVACRDIPLCSHRDIVPPDASGTGPPCRGRRRGLVCSLRREGRCRFSDLRWARRAGPVAASSGPRLRLALGRAGREEGRLLARQGLAVMRAAGALEFLSAGISCHACPMPPESHLGRKRASRCEQQPDQKPCFLPTGVPWGRTAPPPPRPRQEDMTAAKRSGSDGSVTRWIKCDAAAGSSGCHVLSFRNVVRAGGRGLCC